MSIAKIIASMAVTAILALNVSDARADKVISGTWIIGDGTGVLGIHGKTWNHPKYGAGTIQRGAGSANFEVFYNQHQGVRCAYRVMTIADGEILVLESADATQSPDYCPQGKLSRADK
jgi:hypothetical protein